MNASIIIPTYNKLPRLKLTLSSIKNQTYPVEKFEVIIVDNGSTDDTAQFLKEIDLRFPLKYVFMENVGRSAARNKGIEQASYELNIFIDDDLILCPSFIEEHVRLQSQESKVVHGKILNLPFVKFFQDPSTGLLYDTLYDNNNSRSELKKKCLSEKNIKDNFKQAVSANARMTTFETIIHEILTSDTSNAAWLGFTGGNTSVPKKWLNQVGGFDEKFGIEWGCEDLELGYRLYSMGHKFYYADNAVNYHMAHYRASFGEEHLKTSSYFYSKHRDERILYLQEFILGKMKKDELLTYMLN